jgi:hypothetical protein
MRYRRTLFIGILLLSCGYFALAQNKDSTKLFLGISIGPSLEYGTVKLNEEYSPPYPYPNSPPHSGFFSRYLKAQIPKMGVFLKLFVEKPVLSSHFSIFTGLQYEDKGYKTRLFTDTLAIGGSPVRIYKYVDHAHYKYYSIPLGIKYKLLGKRIGISISAGLIYDFAASYLLVSDGLDIVGGPGPPSQISTNMDISIQVGLFLNLNKHVLLSVEPGFVQALKFNAPLVTYEYLARFYSVIFPITLSWRF